MQLGKSSHCKFWMFTTYTGMYIDMLFLNVCECWTTVYQPPSRPANLLSQVIAEEPSPEENSPDNGVVVCSSYSAPPPPPNTFEAEPGGPLAAGRHEFSSTIDKEELWVVKNWGLFHLSASSVPNCLYFQKCQMILLRCRYWVMIHYQWYQPLIFVFRHMVLSCTLFAFPQASIEPFFLFF